MPENGSEQSGVVRDYIRWLFKGNILLVVLKFIWTGMYLTAFLTFKLKAGAIIAGAGIVVWFLWNDKENWYIEWE